MEWPTSVLCTVVLGSSSSGDFPKACSEASVVDIFSDGLECWSSHGVVGTMVLSLIEINCELSL